MGISHNSLFVVSGALAQAAVVIAALGGCSERGSGETGTTDASTTGTTGSSGEMDGDTGAPTTEPGDPSTATGGRFVSGDTTTVTVDSSKPPLPSVTEAVNVSVPT